MARRALGPDALQVVQAVAQLAGPRLLVACSGGPDSLALAAAAAEVGRRRSIPVRAVVVDHGLQADSSQVAAGVVAQLSQRLHLAAEVATVTVAPSGLGPEAAARAARYAALESAAATEELILLGHTLDDQAETVLLGLARGSGSRSLAGMPATRGPFRRPLLGLRRSVTWAACEQWGLVPWVDPHNADDRFARVRVRSRVLPVLEAELGPGIAEALARSAELIRDDADYLDALADAHDALVDGERLDCAALSALASPVRSRVLRSWLLAHGASEVTAQHLGAVSALVTNWRGQRWVDLPGLRVQRLDDALVSVHG
ncbi:MAG: tRNA lysidine(34) synthetase TilS [Propionibacteriales bacterium]|jgi:tRNA(Ile)-lysidine synthase|nr:tRNA lysidine(34) synthetase TilS [Propionibacteriales bacterium]